MRASIPSLSRIFKSSIFWPALSVSIAMITLIILLLRWYWPSVEYLDQEKQLGRISNITHRVTSNPEFDRVLARDDQCNQYALPAGLIEDLRVLDGLADSNTERPDLAYAVALYRIRDGRPNEAWQLASNALKRSKELSDSLRLSLAMVTSTLEAGLRDHVPEDVTATYVADLVTANMGGELSSIARTLHQSRCRLLAVQSFDVPQVVPPDEVHGCYKLCSQKWTPQSTCKTPFDELLLLVVDSIQLQSLVRRPSADRTQMDNSTEIRERARSLASSFFDLRRTVTVESSCDALWLKGIIEYVIGDLCWSVELFSDAEAFAAMSVKTLRRDAGVCDAALALALLSRCRRVRGDYEAAADPAREAWSIARQCRNMAGAKRAAVLLTSLAIALEPQTSDNVIRALQQMTQAAQQFDDNVFRAIIVCEAFRLLENSGLPKPEFWPVLESIKEKSQISCSRGQ